MHSWRHILHAKCTDELCHLLTHSPRECEINTEMKAGESERAKRVALNAEFSAVQNYNQNLFVSLDVHRSFFSPPLACFARLREI